VPDTSFEFESVTDKTPLGLRDNAAYAVLLGRARAIPAPALAAQSRRDVLLTHLWDRPTHYRGVPIHLLGTARRVLRYESKLSRTGWLYEAWIFTPESPRVPFVCVLEQPPAGFPLGLDVSERVVFDGYFLKLMRYQAGDVARAAPLLIGRLGWSPHPDDDGGSSRSPVFWMTVAIGVMFVISLIRWIVQLRRSFAPKPKPSLLRNPPAEEIAPEALAQWLESLPGDDRDAAERDERIG
jgi:hypothetical protein